MFKHVRSFIITTALAVVTCTANSQTCMTWSSIAGSGPGPRRTAAAAYDSARGRLVLFGGECTGFPTDTWEWDGRSWTDVTPKGASPAGRYGHAMTYDSKRGRVVLFGGQGNGPALNDTWEWDGTSWTEISPSGSIPPPRIAPAMAFDQASGRTILYGGDGTSDPGHLGDTWTWDGNSWTELVIAVSPGPRAYAAMTYDSNRRRAVLFGGEPAGNVLALSDTWEFDGATNSWTQMATTGPARHRFGMVFDIAQQRTVIFGGGDGGGFNPNVFYSDTWQWNGTAWTSVPVSLIGARQNQAGALDCFGRIVCFGGWAGGDCIGQTMVYGPNPADTDWNNSVNVSDLLNIITNWGALSCP